MTTSLHPRMLGAEVEVQPLGKDREGKAWFSYVVWTGTRTGTRVDALGFASHGPAGFETEAKRIANERLWGLFPKEGV